MFFPQMFVYKAVSSREDTYFLLQKGAAATCGDENLKRPQ